MWNLNDVVGPQVEFGSQFRVCRAMISHRGTQERVDAVCRD